MEDPDQVLQILLIEDNPADAFLFEEALRAEGAAVAMCVIEKGDQVKAELIAHRLLESRYHCLILDLSVPGFDGEQLVADLRNDLRLIRIPLLVWTSSEDPLLEERIRQMGVLHYLHKPLDLDGYRDIARKVLGTVARNLRQVGRGPDGTDCGPTA